MSPVSAVPSVVSLLAVAHRHLRLATPAESADATTRSYLDDGRCLGWYAPPVPRWRVAIDAERVGAPVPTALARRFGTGEFWARWTRAECLAKLTDVPMAIWWQRHGLEVPPRIDWLWRTLTLADLVVTVAFVATDRPRDTADVPLPDGDPGSRRPRGDADHPAAAAHYRK
ncbi:hypothetical protein ADL17_09215 [Micromonospora maris]|uniref:Uncharacterized protein n=1 Tax=Micromonospora maris TaxID=1003110 RepID=A0A9X0I8T9_9ACTN|nr:hypothetical protein ADL17_09215 [Micromonospora maris]